MIELGIAFEGELGTICEDKNEHEFFQAIQQPDSEFYDDMSGKPLEPSLVSEARAEEIQGAMKHGVWENVSTKECIEKTGKLPVGTRWVDINKGDEINPIYIDPD